MLHTLMNKGQGVTKAIKTGSAYADPVFMSREDGIMSSQGIVSIHYSL